MSIVHNTLIKQPLWWLQTNIIQIRFKKGDQDIAGYRAGKFPYNPMANDNSSCITAFVTILLITKWQCLFPGIVVMQLLLVDLELTLCCLVVCLPHG